MLNYIGQYRTEYERDKQGYAMEGSYIKCKNGGEIYRYSTTLLCLYIPSLHRGRKVEEGLKDKIKTIEYGDEETRIYFDENYIKDFAVLGGAMTKGKNKKPVKNMRPKPKVEVKHEDKKNYKYRVLINKKIYKDNLTLIQANKLISTLKASQQGEITRGKYSF